MQFCQKSRWSHPEWWFHAVNLHFHFIFLLFICSHEDWNLTCRLWLWEMVAWQKIRWRGAVGFKGGSKWLITAMVVQRQSGTCNMQLVNKSGASKIEHDWAIFGTSDWILHSFCSHLAFFENTIPLALSLACLKCCFGWLLLLNLRTQVLFRACRCAALPEVTQVVVPQETTAVGCGDGMSQLGFRKNTANSGMSMDIWHMDWLA